MARPLRVEFSGAIYHVTSRGNAQADIYLDDTDRADFLDTLANVIERFGWVCHAYCLMTNHYHLVIETPQANLAQAMRQLNGVYTQRFNRRHHRVGHIFQGRYKAILVEHDVYLLELGRYVVLNPVRAGMVEGARHWPWSSYRGSGWCRAMPFMVEYRLAAFPIWQAIAAL
ncbi:MAG: transposase [Mariprofundales bacterium]